MSAPVMSAARILKAHGPYALAVAGYQRARALWSEKLLGETLVRRRIHDFELMPDVQDPGLSRALLLYGTREAEHRAILASVLRPGMTVLDIGANIGYYAVMELRLMGGRGQVVAVEPVPSNVELLRRNLILNGYEQAQIIESAVSDSSGRRRLNLSSSSNLHSFHRVAGQERDAQSDQIDVEVRSVPDIVRAVGPIDLMRMDVEGHEVEILAGMVPAVEAGDMAPSILFEAHHHYYSAEHDIRPLLVLLFAAGYRTRYLGSANKAGTERIGAFGYPRSEPIKTDGTERVLFEHVAARDAIALIGETDSVRSVLLEHEGPSAGQVRSD